MPNNEERDGKTRQSRIRKWAIARQDPSVNKGLDQFERKEMSAEILDVDGDLGAFDRFRGDRGSTKFFGEYHKEGAPYMDVEGFSAYEPPIGEPEVPRDNNPITPKVDPWMIEILTYALFRSAFGKGLNIPIRREGMVDMDVTVKGKDININTKELFFQVPELVVWKIAYGHKGRPVVEIGRDVKNGMKVHRLGAIRLIMEMWIGTRNRNRKKARLDKGAPPADEVS